MLDGILMLTENYVQEEAVPLFQSLRQFEDLHA